MNRRRPSGSAAATTRRAACAGLAFAAMAWSSPSHAQVANPTFNNVTVHDPSVIKTGARWYVYGSHGASAWTEDLLNWTQVATGVNSGNPAHFNTFGSELSELIAWTNADTLWAADVVQLPDGKFYYYYNVWTNYLSYRSYMGLASADGIEGPFSDLGEIMRGGSNVPGFNPSIHPNTIDPDVFYDRDGQLWMVYGSYSGGIFILRLDQTVGSPTFGRPVPGQSWGTKLIGGNHARIEGPCIIYSPESEYYYLFLSFGGLGANDGYNMRVARSRNPDGPYVDASNTELTNIGGSDSQIAPYGVKLMGNYQFTKQAGEPNGAASTGYRSPGHNSVYYDPATGKYFLIFHTRFQGTGEFHQVRVHQMYLNSDGWFVVSPHRFARETLSAVDPARIAGNWKMINHGKAISGTLNTSTNIVLSADGSITGAATGSWELSEGRNAALTVNGTVYRGVFSPQWDDDSQVWVMAFTALSSDGVSLWGSKFAEVASSVGPAIVQQPVHQAAAAGARVMLRAGATGLPPPTFQWKKNGANIAGATGTGYTIAAAAAGDAALYTAEVTGSSAMTSDAAVVGILTSDKVFGAGSEVGPNILHQNGNRYDQVLLQGGAATITADGGQITRISFVDVTLDIVQIEFSGAGSLTVNLDAASGPAAPENYNQPSVAYMKGHARIVVVGANETTNVSVFSVGRATAFDPTGTFNFLQPISSTNNPANNGSSLFQGHGATNYDGWANIASIAIVSTNGRFGGIRTGNTSYFGTSGVVGIYAPGVTFDGPVVVGDITAAESATPMLVLGAAADTRVAGGDFDQTNAQPVRVSGLTQLRFVGGGSSHGVIVSAQVNRGRLQQGGVDVTDQIVVNPAP